MSSNNNFSGSTFSILGFVDGLWDLTKVAKVIYFTLCFDILFFYLKGSGLFGLKLGKEFDLSVADLAGMIIVLGVFSSVILKFAAFLFSLLLINVRFSSLFNYKVDLIDRGLGDVSFEELRKDALANGDDLSYKLYSEEYKEREKIRKDNWSAEIISFGIALVFSVEWYLSSADGKSKMFIDWLWAQLRLRDPEIPHYCVGMICTLILAAYATFICWPKGFEPSIYYPKLASKIKKEKAERNNKNIFP